MKKYIGLPDYWKPQPELRALAKELGYTEVLGVMYKEDPNPPISGVQFHLPNKVIWGTMLGWCCADKDYTTTAFYANHRYNNDLEAVLRKEVSS